MLDTHGQPQTAFQNRLQNIPAEIVQLSGREGELARARFPEATHRIRTRYLIDAEDPKARFVFGSKTFNIISSDNLEMRNIEHVHLCGEQR